MLVLFGRRETVIERLDHSLRSAAPSVPVSSIDDDVRVTRPVALETFAEIVGHPGEPFLRVREAARPVEEMQEVGETVELKQFVARPGHGNSGLASPLFERRRLETAFEVNVDFGFGQAAQRDNRCRVSKCFRHWPLSRVSRVHKHSLHSQHI